MKIVFNILSGDYDATDAQIEEYRAELKKQVSEYYPEATVVVKLDGITRADNADLRTTDVSVFKGEHPKPMWREKEVALWCNHLRESIADFCHIKVAA